MRRPWPALGRSAIKKNLQPQCYVCTSLPVFLFVCYRPVWPGASRFSDFFILFCWQSEGLLVSEDNVNTNETQIVGTKAANCIPSLEDSTRIVLHGHCQWLSIFFSQFIFRRITKVSIPNLLFFPAQQRKHWRECCVPDSLTPHSFVLTANYHLPCYVISARLCPIKS
jgi:hypothetical protein